MLELRYEKVSKGKYQVLAQVAESILHADSGDPCSHKFRSGFMKQLREVIKNRGMDGIQDEHLVELEESLIELSQESLQESTESQTSVSADTIRRHILDLANQEKIELFEGVTEGTTAGVFLGFDSRDGRIVAPINADRIKLFIIDSCVETFGETPKQASVIDVIKALEAKILTNGNRFPIGKRVICTKDKIWLNMANEKNQVIEVSKDGWDVVTDPPVRFLYQQNIFPLPEPDRNGDITCLDEIIPFEREEQFQMVVGWMLGQFLPSGENMVLMVVGPEGSGKSVTVETVKYIIDPRRDLITNLPDDKRDFLALIHSNHTLAIDNASYMSNEISDLICQATSGVSLSERKLFSNGEVFCTFGRTPVVINSITPVIGRHDLLSRTGTIEFCHNGNRRTRTRTEIEELRRERHPKILGAILDALVACLRGWRDVQLEEKIRLADLGQWVTAGEEVLPYPVGSFVKAMAKSQRENTIDNLIDDEFTGSVLDFVKKRGGEYESTIGNFLASLRRDFPDVAESKAFPRTAKGLSAALLRNEKAFREVGLSVSRTPRTRDGYRVILKLEEQTPEKRELDERGVNIGDSESIEQNLDFCRE